MKDKSVDTRLAELEWRMPHPAWQHQVAPAREPLPPPAAHCRSREQMSTAFGWLGDTVQAASLRQLTEEQVEQQLRGDTSPVPDPDTREGYWRDNHLAYWLSGLSDYLFLSDLIAEHRGGSAAAYRVLDFGCSSGRVLRHFARQRTDLELFGCDADGNSIRWLRDHLPPAALGFVNTIYPPLPLPDASVDFAYALSVFTHVDAFEESWLLELRRVLKPGGRALLTVSTERVWPQIGDPNHFILQVLTRRRHVVAGRPDLPVDLALFRKPMPAQRVVILDAADPIKCLFTFHHLDYIRQRWGRIFEIERVIPKAHGEHQDAMLLRKPG